MSAVDDAFEEYRKVKFGAYNPYPIDAYTYFCAGWKAASSRPALPCTHENKRSGHGHLMADGSGEINWSCPQCGEVWKETFPPKTAALTS